MSALPTTVNQRPFDQEPSGQRSFPSQGMSAGSLEWKLLLAAASSTEGSRTHIPSLLTTQHDHPIDWPSLLRGANFHGVSSLLYQNLAPFADVVPAQTLELLRTAYAANMQKALVLSRELNRILDRAGSLGIELIPYKGVVLSESYYGDIAMRQVGDLDLFVRRRDMIRARAALRELEYVPRLDIPATSEADYIAAGYEYSFDGPLGKAMLELQWALQPRYYAVDYDMDALFTRVAEITLSGSHIKTLSPEDLLLVLCLHAAKHVWGRLIWLCDIAQILKRGNLDFPSAVSRARELGIMRILHVTLLLANRFLETPIPAALEPALRSDSAARALAEEVAPSIISGISWEEHKTDYFRLMMRLRERPSDRLRFLIRLAFTPGPGEWQTLKLPRLLSPLYRAVRMVRLAARFAKR